MISYFQNMNLILQALIATCFTWGMTSLGAAIVFMAKDVNRKILDCMLGISGGVMMAASF